MENDDEDLLEELGKSRKRRGPQQEYQPLPQRDLDEYAHMMQVRGARDDGDELR